MFLSVMKHSPEHEFTTMSYHFKSNIILIFVDSTDVLLKSKTLRFEFETPECCYNQLD